MTGITPECTMKKTLPINETKIVGFGGAGITIINSIAKENIPPNSTILAADTNICPLIISCNSPWICFGRKTAHGMGCGNSTNLAEAVFKESKKELSEFIGLKTTKTLYLLAGFGGATGAVTATRLASLAKKQGITVCSIITMPFKKENARQKKAKKYCQQMIKNSNLTITLNLEELQKQKPEACILDCFNIANNIIAKTLQKITKEINCTKYDKKAERITFAKNQAQIKIGKKTLKIQ